MPHEVIGESVTIETPNHPTRKDSPEYLQSRKALMARPTGCIVCGGAHVPGQPYEDHHGGGLYVGDTFLGFGLHGMEWSLGWGADPVKIAAMVSAWNGVLRATLQPTYDLPITDPASVMAFVDSVSNANVCLCRGHHVGHPSSHSPDIHGREAVGIHEIPFPIWIAQVYCDWTRWDMWGGSTGTIAVAPHADGSGKAEVLYVHHSHAEPLKVGDTLPATHPASRAAHAGVQPAPADLAHAVTAPRD